LFNGGKKVAPPYKKNERDKQTSFSSNPRYLPVHDALSDVTTTPPRFFLVRVVDISELQYKRVLISTRAAAVLASEAPLSVASAQSSGG
jgi:hypothetical protein